MGYQQTARIRLSPASGPDQTIDLATAFTDLRGPAKTEFAHEIELDQRMDVNRALRPVIYGARGEAELTLDILTMDDQRDLARIVNALMAPEDWTVYLSGDAGVTERAVVISRYTGPTPLAGKPHVGARYVLQVRSRDLIQELPAIGDAGHW